MQNKVFLDVNVLLEILLERKNISAAKKILNKYDGNLHISTLTAHLIAHFGLQFIDMPTVKLFLSDYYIEPLTDNDFDWAFSNARSKDFEDALQLSVAIKSGCNLFITFDKKLYDLYKSLPTIKVKLIRP